jgi:serine O-acetyltransferase
VVSTEYKKAEERLQLQPVESWGRLNDNPQGMSLWQLLKEDLATHDGNMFEQGFWALACHRFGNWRMNKPKIMRAPCTLVYQIWSKWVQILGGITMHYTVKVGRRVRIWHHGGMVIGARYIGNDVHLRQNVTIGVAQTYQRELPIIDDGVDIGCGASILGSIYVGHRAKIAANTLVIGDVPENAMAIGVPAKIMRIGNARMNITKVTPLENSN